MHVEIIKKGFDKDLLIGSTLVDMYVQIGLIEVTRQVFDNLPVKDVILWTALIIGYVEHEHGQEALNLMKEMQTHNILPNTFVLVSGLKVCGDTRDINQCSVIHAEIVKKGLHTETFIANTLVGM